MKIEDFNTVLIPLTRGKWAIVSAEDAGKLLKHRWHTTQNRASAPFYAERSVREGKKVHLILMHREIFNAQWGEEIDHRDGDGLNNRRKNLRFCDHGQNQQNRRKLQRDNTSGFKGVSPKLLPSGKQRWAATICIDGRTKHIGYFDTPEEAASAYDIAAREFFGEFAATNSELET